MPLAGRSHDSRAFPSVFFCINSSSGALSQYNRGQRLKMN